MHQISGDNVYININTVNFSQFSYALPAAMLTKYFLHSILRKHLRNKYFRTLKQLDSNVDRIKFFTRVWFLHNKHKTVLYILYTTHININIAVIF